MAHNTALTSSKDAAVTGPNTKKIDGKNTVPAPTADLVKLKMAPVREVVRTGTLIAEVLSSSPPKPETLVFLFLSNSVEVCCCGDGETEDTAALVVDILIIMVPVMDTGVKFKLNRMQ